MNVKLCSSLIVTLLTTGLSTISSCQAQAPNAREQETKASHLRASTSASPQESTRSVYGVKVGSQSEHNGQTDIPENKRHSPDTALPAPLANAQSVDTVKVGEYRSRQGNETQADPIAKVEPHLWAGRQAATLYLRNIPVITFIGSASDSIGDIKVGKAGDGKDTLSAENEAEVVEPRSFANQGQNFSQQRRPGQSERDPVWRASVLAAKLNQLNRDNVDANTIAVVWNGEANTVSTSLPSSRTRRNSQQEFQSATRDRQIGESYIIKVNEEQLVQIDADTRLPDSTNNLAQDALQVTNRLRRLIGNAPPLRDIAGRPTAKPIQIALTTAPVLSRLRGLASWYGPGFHGRRSANGEIYNQNALTAAHRTLPFGTQVRVTNLNNGLSVVVRINDRGPYAGRRIIDLSAAAARVLGMMQTGVAPVSLEVLGKSQTVAVEQN
ncbi:septal ring lytic transglycosylase RlpA family protein [Aerosakkonema sp. BLCC-F183]|uniref:septal ring lytic transglycosylase RlpA family protein n=1 Tax=Aerosakkonema sp. BLCC-F183 TaxID=3342834 RepID=UPI0035B879C4